MKVTLEYFKFENFSLLRSLSNPLLQSKVKSNFLQLQANYTNCFLDELLFDKKVKAWQPYITLTLANV